MESHVQGQNQRKPLTINRVALTEQTYEVIKEQILDQAIEPGSRLNIDRLVADLGVSSSPVREALGRLHAEHLVDFAPYIGYSAAPIPNDQWFEDMIRFRILLEGECAQIGASRRTDAVLESLRAALEEMKKSGLGQHYRKYRRYSDADAHFHYVIVDSAGNVISSQVYRSLQPHVHHARLYLDRGAEREIVTAEQHQAIFDAFVAADGRAAKAAVENHLNSTLDHLLRSAATARDRNAVISTRRRR